METSNTALEQRLFPYAYAPKEYRALFPIPDAEKQHMVFILEEKLFIPRRRIVWILPNSRWWSLWNSELSKEIDEHTTVYLLTEKTEAP